MNTTMALGSGPPGRAELHSAWEKRPASTGFPGVPALNRGPLPAAPQGMTRATRQWLMLLLALVLFLLLSYWTH